MYELAEYTVNTNLDSHESSDLRLSLDLSNLLLSRNLFRLFNFLDWKRFRDFFLRHFRHFFQFLCRRFVPENVDVLFGELVQVVDLAQDGSLRQLLDLLLLKLGLTEGLLGILSSLK